MGISQRNPCHSCSDAYPVTGLTQLCCGKVDVGVRHSEPGPTFREIGNLLFDTDLDLRRELATQLERSRPAYRQVLDARAKARIGQFIGSVGDLAPGVQS